MPESVTVDRAYLEALENLESLVRYYWSLPRPVKEQDALSNFRAQIAALKHLTTLRERAL